MALVSATDFKSLPLEPISRWLDLRDLLEKRLDFATDTMQGVSDEHLLEYCDVLVSAAEELKLGAFSSYSTGNIRDHYVGIRSEIVKLATKLSLRASDSNAAFSVALRRDSRAKILAQVKKLRTLVSESDLAESKKKALFDKLDELNSLTTSPRTDFAKLMQVLAYLALGLGGTTAFLADAPDALATISAVVAEAKEDEEEELLFLKAREVPLQLEDLRALPEIDDQIPF
jgi:hypothetical protein